MPLWAVFYIVSLVVSAVFTVYISQSKSPLYIAGQMASALFASAFMLIYYNQIPYPRTIITPILMLFFILFQEIWVNRELYNMLSLKNFPKTTHRFMLITVPLITLSYISPLVWIVSQVFKHYFLSI